MSQELEPELKSQSQKARMSQNQRVSAREKNLTQHKSKILFIQKARVRQELEPLLKSQSQNARMSRNQKIRVIESENYES